MAGRSHGGLDFGRPGRGGRGLNCNLPLRDLDVVGGVGAGCVVVADGFDSVGAFVRVGHLDTSMNWL
jgi:hypothetical protein